MMQPAAACFKLLVIAALPTASLTSLGAVLVRPDSADDLLIVQIAGLRLACGHAAVCRHQQPLPGCACNMIQTGERFAYHHFLAVQFVSQHQRRLGHLWCDIACKIEPHFKK